MMWRKLLHHSLCEDIVGPAHHKNIFFAKSMLMSKICTSPKAKSFSYDLLMQPMCTSPKAYMCTFFEIN